MIIGNQQFWQMVLLLGIIAVHFCVFWATCYRRAVAVRRSGWLTAFFWAIGYLALLLLAGWRLYQFGPASWPTVAVGFGLLIGGVGLRFWALNKLGRWFSELVVIRQGQKLITDGPYRWLRHPLHVGLLAQMAGLAAVAGGLWAWLVFAAGVVNALARELHEQRVLGEHFGHSYAVYSAGTWGLSDFLPKWSGWRGPAGGSNGQKDSRGG